MDLIDEARDIQDEIDSTLPMRISACSVPISSMVSTWSLRLPIPFRLKLHHHSDQKYYGNRDSPRKIHPFRACADLRFQYNPRERRPGCRCIPKVKDLTVKLSMVENAAYRLATNIKKTQKRANALQNITIPMYTELVYNITNALEEKEREEFTRLKVIKRMKQKKSGG